MTQKIITLFGRERDQHGMPEPFHRYLILESGALWLGINHYIASIVPLTEIAPIPIQRQIHSDRGMNQALALAAEAVRQHPQMRGLRVQEN